MLNRTKIPTAIQWRDRRSTGDAHENGQGCAARRRDSFYPIVRGDACAGVGRLRSKPPSQCVWSMRMGRSKPVLVPETDGACRRSYARRDDALHQVKAFAFGAVQGLCRARRRRTPARTCRCWSAGAVATTQTRRTAGCGRRSTRWRSWSRRRRGRGRRSAWAAPRAIGGCASRAPGAARRRPSDATTTPAQ